MIQTLHQNLRSSTQFLHKTLDQSALMSKLAQPDINLNTYLRVLKIQMAFFAQFEPFLIEWAPWRDLGIDPFPRQKLRFLLEDFEYFGIDPNFCGALFPQLDLRRNLPTEAHCVGATYVIEGSTLGMQLLSINLKKSLNITAGGGASFYNAYGETTALRWREFLRALENYGATHSHEQIVEGAIYTFQAFIKLSR